MTRGWDLTPPRNLGARPELFPGLRSDVTDYGNNAIQLRPARRRKRGALTPQDIEQGAVEIPDVGGVEIGTRFWPIHVSTAAATRTTIVSPGFTAPAMIYAYHLEFGNPGGEAEAALIWSTEDGGEVQDGAETLVPSGTKVFEPIGYRVSGTTFTGSIREAWSLRAGISHAVAAPIRYIVRHQGLFFLKFTMRGGVASPISSRGEFVIIEAASFEKLLAVA